MLSRLLAMLSITSPNAFHQDKDYPGNNSKLGCAQEGNYWSYRDYSCPKLVPLGMAPLDFGAFGQPPLESVDHTFPATRQLAIDYSESVKLELTRPLSHRCPSNFMTEPDI